MSGRSERTVELKKALTGAREPVADPSDVLVLSSETAYRVLANDGLATLRAIEAEEPKSVRALADGMGISLTRVTEAVNVLLDADAIDLIDEGRSQRPVLAHTSIVVEPLVFDGAGVF